MDTCSENLPLRPLPLRPFWFKTLGGGLGVLPDRDNRDGYPP